MPDLAAMTPAELERHAQTLGEEALEALWENEDACSCSTCEVREVLEAAWPVLVELAGREVPSSS